MKEGVFLRKSKAKIRFAFITGIVFLLIIAIMLSTLFIRKVISGYAKEQATSILFGSANRSVGNFLAESGVTYNDIVKLTRNSNNDISSLEIDIVKINELKSKITTLISDSMTSGERYTISVPLGTLFGNEFTLGLGPEIKFKMQMVASVNTDFQSNFYAAGINQVLHQILITVKINGNLIIPWCRTPFYTETSVIAAQTVLVGITPEAYTNVIESYSYGQDGVVGDIFDYGATKN